MTNDELASIFEASTSVCWPREGDYAGLSGRQISSLFAAIDRARQAPAPVEVSRLAELRREVERLTEERNAAFAMSRCECAASEFCAQLVAAETEVEALRADAERYRWLRNNPPMSLCVRQDRATAFNTTAVYIDGQNLDAAIDTARASTDEEVGK